MGKTAQQIAKMANVSRATVYRVVNNLPGVKPETQKAVQAIIDQYQYKPNIAGKALVKQRNQGLIGVILPQIRNDFYRLVKQGLEAAIDEYKYMGFRFVYQYMKSFSVQDQIDCIHNLKKMQVDAICLVAIEHDAVRQALDSIADEVIIIPFISDISGIRKLCFVGNELERSGRVAFELIKKLLGDQGNVAIICTAMNLQAHQERVRGFQSKHKDCESNIKILDIFENQDSDRKTYRIVEKLLTRNAHTDQQMDQEAEQEAGQEVGQRADQEAGTTEKVDAIYMTTGLGTAGLGQALEKYDPHNTIRVIASDTTQATKALLKKEIIDFTICQNPFQEGYMPIKILFDFLSKNERPAAERFYTRTDVRVWENAMNESTDE